MKCKLSTKIISVLLVLASTHYDGSEYIRDYDEYMREINLI